MTVEDLIGFGSIFEDDRFPTQALRHFFNPRTGKGIFLDGQERGEASPFWIIDGGTDNQPFSYKKARDYYYDALTNTLGPVDRRLSWGKTFQTLGHIIHHLQDMAQPQHVRNDVHCDAIIPCLFPIQLGVKDTVFAPSLYERWVQRNAPTSFTGYAPVNDSSDSFKFTLPKQFWSTGGTGAGVDSGMGIAEYTHRGFLSAGTLKKSADFPFPDTDNMTVAPVARLETLWMEFMS